MEDIWVRSSLSGASSGISTYGVDILDEVEARELRVAAEDLCETAPEVREDLAVDTRAGILEFFCVVETAVRLKVVSLIRKFSS